jgi:hypothetical protein
MNLAADESSDGANPLSVYKRLPVKILEINNRFFEVSTLK